MFLDSLGQMGSIAKGLASGFKKKFIGSLGSGEIPIPCKAVEVVLRKKLDGEGIELRSICCKSSGFGLELLAEKMGTGIKMDLLLQVKSLKIKEDQAELLIKVVRSDMHGTNLLGKIVSFVVHAILKDVLSGMIHLSSLQSKISYNKSSKEAYIDLNGLSAIDRLYSRNLLPNRMRIIDLIQIVAVRHTDNGLALSYDLADDLGGQVLNAIKAVLANTSSEGE